MIDEAIQRKNGSSQTNIDFLVDDIFATKLTSKFSIVASARVLQWLEKPQVALERMKALTAQDGKLVILDYNHEKIRWSPQPPKSFQKFYKLFLRWRTSSGMDNAIADKLEGMLKAAGFGQIRLVEQNELAVRGTGDFFEQLDLWAKVLETRGKQMVAHDFLKEEERMKAIDEYRHWIQTEAKEQELFLTGAVGET